MSRRAWVVVDLGFGDAGKGSVVDFLVRDRGAGLVVRFNGGAQAGHTVVAEDGRLHTFSQFGAGSFVPEVRTHHGPEVALHLGGMAVEAEVLAGKGVPDAFERTTVDERALLISPFQQAAGRLRELLRGAESHGSCGVGLGEARADALAGMGDSLRAADLRDADRLRQRLASQQRRKRLELGAAKRLFEPKAFSEWGLLDDPRAVDSTVELWRRVAGQLQVLDERACRTLVSGGDEVVFEGAQGVLLDQTWGFHPHTTWSDCTFAGAMALLADRGGEVSRLGLTRSYSVRHGKGPMPTHAPTFDQILDEPHNHEMGWQGRFRRGPLDLVLLRYAVEVCGGVDGVVLTHVDRIGDNWPLCAAYQLDETAPGVRRDAHEQVLGLIPGRPEVLEDREQLTALLGWVEPLHLTVTRSQLLGVLGRELKAPVILESRGPAAGDKRWLKAPPRAS